MVSVVGVNGLKAVARKLSNSGLSKQALTGDLPTDVNAAAVMARNLSMRVASFSSGGGKDEKKDIEDGYGFPTGLEKKTHDGDGTRIVVIDSKDSRLTTADEEHENPNADGRLSAAKLEQSLQAKMKKARENTNKLVRMVKDGEIDIDSEQLDSNGKKIVSIKEKPILKAEPVKSKPVGKELSPEELEKSVEGKMQNAMENTKDLSEIAVDLQENGGVVFDRSKQYPNGYTFYFMKKGAGGESAQQKKNAVPTKPKFNNEFERLKYEAENAKKTRIKIEQVKTEKFSKALEDWKKEDPEQHLNGREEGNSFIRNG